MTASSAATTKRRSAIAEGAGRAGHPAPQPGNSGGPLLDFGGGVIGVVNAKMDDFAVANAIGTLPQNVNFAIKKNVLANFLETHDVPYVERDRGPDISLVEIAERAKKFTVLLVCTTGQ